MAPPSPSEMLQFTDSSPFPRLCLSSRSSNSLLNLVQAEKKGWVSILFFSLIDLTGGGLNQKYRRKAALGLGVSSQPELAHLDQISFPPDLVHAIRLSFLESLEAKAHQTFGSFKMLEGNNLWNLHLKLD